MLRLTAEQFTLIGDITMHRFVERMVAELPGYVGPWIEGRSRDTLFQAANKAVELAEAHGISTERDLFQFVNLAIMLGARFDVDPALPWAGQILRDCAYLDGREKMNDLWNAATNYLDEVLGDENPSTPVAAFRRYRPNTPYRPQGQTLTMDDVAQLETLWPEKTRLLTFEQITATMTMAAERAYDYGLTSAAHQWRYCRIAYLTGAVFDADPLHDWAVPALTRPASPDEVTDALETAFVTSVIEPALHSANRELQEATE